MHRKTSPLCERGTGCLYPCPAGVVGNSSSLSTPRCGGDCPRGFFCGERTVMPSACPLGTRQPALGARALDSCIGCSPGSFSAMLANVNSTCSPCSAGTFSEEAGASACSSCPSGGFCPHAGASSRLVFQPCPVGHYNEERGAVGPAACLGCPAGKASTNLGATSASQCVNCTVGTRPSKQGWC